MVDRATGYSVNSLMLSRSMEDAIRMIKTKWFDIHGAPASMSGDPEFNNTDTHAMCAEQNVKYEARPARRHNKIGTVESANSTVRLLVQRIQKDEAHFRTSRPGFRPASDYEILSRATFLKKMIYGRKIASSFELAKG